MDKIKTDRIMLDNFHFIKNPSKEGKNKKKLFRNDVALFAASFSSLACASNTNTIKRKVIMELWWEFSQFYIKNSVPTAE